MKKLFEKTIIITEQDAKSHIRIDFFVPEGYQKLVINTSYSPKYEYDMDRCKAFVQKCYINADREGDFDALTMSSYLPLANHISWSIDSPDGYIGTKHLSKPFQKHTISSEWASEGFLPTPIRSGQWSVTASINSIVTEWAEITIEVEGYR
ncbi:MAG: hypothetical protein ACI4M5_01210 [Christensenellales bacterium]